MSEERLQQICEMFLGTEPFDCSRLEAVLELRDEILRLSVVPAQQLTGDDDSVEHAWNTTPTSVVIDCDKGIAPLVDALNKIPGVRTFASCEGHPHSTTGNTSPYITLYIGDVKQVAVVSEAIEKAISPAPATYESAAEWGLSTRR